MKEFKLIVLVLLFSMICIHNFTCMLLLMWPDKSELPTTVGNGTRFEAAVIANATLISLTLLLAFAKFISLIGDHFVDLCSDSLHCEQQVKGGQGEQSKAATHKTHYATHNKNQTPNEVSQLLQKNCLNL